MGRDVVTALEWRIGGMGIMGGQSGRLGGAKTFLSPMGQCFMSLMYARHLVFKKYMTSPRERRVEWACDSPSSCVHTHISRESTSLPHLCTVRAMTLRHQSYPPPRQREMKPLTRP